MAKPQKDSEWRHRYIELRSELDRLNQLRNSDQYRLIAGLVSDYALVWEAAHPLEGASQSDGGPRRRRVPGAPPPGSGTRRYRSLLRRVDRRIEAIRSEISAGLSDEPAPTTKRRCTDCGRGGPLGAKFCAYCGTDMGATR